MPSHLVCFTYGPCYYLKPSLLLLDGSWIPQGCAIQDAGPSPCRLCLHRLVWGKAAEVSQVILLERLRRLQKEAEPETESLPRGSLVSERGGLHSSVYYANGPAGGTQEAGGRKKPPTKRLKVELAVCLKEQVHPCTTSSIASAWQCLRGSRFKDTPVKALGQQGFSQQWVMSNRRSAGL